MEQINEREIPNFFDLENSLKADGKVDMTTFMQFLKSKGNLEDKIRLLCICVLCRDRDLVSQAETAFTEYLETLQGRTRPIAMPPRPTIPFAVPSSKRQRESSTSRRPE